MKGNYCLQIHHWNLLVPYISTQLSKLSIKENDVMNLLLLEIPKMKLFSFSWSMED